MHKLTKVNENYNCDLPKVSNLTIADNFYLPKVTQMIKVTCLKLVKVASDLLHFDINPEA